MQTIDAATYLHMTNSFSMPEPIKAKMDRMYLKVWSFSYFLSQSFIETSQNSRVVYVTDSDQTWKVIPQCNWSDILFDEKHSQIGLSFRGLTDYGFYAIIKPWESKYSLRFSRHIREGY